VMSAPRSEKPGQGGPFHFKMDKPVAPYLIALAVGDLAFRELGPRFGSRMPEAAKAIEQLDPATIKAVFDQYQGIRDHSSNRWLESRRTAIPGG